MPIYCYTNTNHGTVDKFFRLGEAPESVTHDGKEFLRDLVAEQRGFVPEPGDLYHYASEAFGVAPHQVAEERVRLKRLTGRDVEFTSDGRMLITSRSQRRAVAEACGMHDRNAGYSDPVPHDKLGEWS